MVASITGVVNCLEGSVLKTSTICFEWLGQDGLDRAVRDARVEVAGGAAQLHRRIVVADEMGNCNNRDIQPIDGRTWARKDFWLERVEVAGARVSSWLRTMESGEITRNTATHGAPETMASELVIVVNGHPQTLHPQEDATQGMQDPLAIYPGYWQSGWLTVQVPPEWLRSGLNTIILCTVDGSRWETLIETNRFPNRSAQSLDGGETWDFDHLGFNHCYDGEFLIRIELDCFPTNGRLTSEVFDLAISGDHLGTPIVPRQLFVDAECDTPAGTAVEWELRAGSVPAFAPDDWSAWKKADTFEVRRTDRFAQWQATLRTENPLATPVVRSVKVSVEAEVDKFGLGRIVAERNPAILHSSHRFGYQAPTSRALMMRQRWLLDDLVAGTKNDYETITRLAHWTRDQWKDGWNVDMKALRLCPPWDAPLILELAKHNLAMGMCTHYSTVLVQACASLGIPARHLILKAHCTAEVWSDHWGKWIWVDAGGDLSDETMAVAIVERDGVPLSALESRTAWFSQQISNLRFVGRNAENVFNWNRLAQLDHFCIPLRNDHMTSLNPGELEHGKVWYHYDGYLWWRDEQTSPLPWFTLSSSRIDDFYWTPNCTHIHLQRTFQKGELRVHLESSMPNLNRMLVKIDNADWQEKSTEFIWPVHSGQNCLLARSVNTFGKEGAANHVTVEL